MSVKPQETIIFGLSCIGKAILRLLCGFDDEAILKRESLIYTLELPQKFDFQPSTTKLDNKDHPTVETGKFNPLDGF